MYNRYLAAAEDAPADAPAQPAGLFGGLRGLRLDRDTVIVLVIVWFLLSGDGDGNGGIDWEQLMLIGVLLLAGV